MNIGKPVGGLEMKTPVGLATNKVHLQVQHADSGEASGSREAYWAVRKSGLFNRRRVGLVRENG